MHKDRMQTIAAGNKGPKNEIQILFPALNEVRKQQKKLFEVNHSYKIPVRTEIKKNSTIFRYIPSRVIMQRIVLRATQLKTSNGVV